MNKDLSVTTSQHTIYDISKHHLKTQRTQLIVELQLLV